MTNENMTMNDAIDMAFDLATTKGTGEPIVEDATVEETPQDAPETTEAQEVTAETPAETTEVETTTPEVEAEVEPDDLAAKLTDLTHDDVVHSKAGKGLFAELQREREKRQELQAQLDARNAPKPKAEDEAEPDEDDIDDAADVYTAGDVKKIVSREVAKALKPVAERFVRTDKAEWQQVMATGLAALASEQKAGSIPAGVNTATIVTKAIETLKASRPALYQELLSEPDPVRAVWEYATARMPEAKQAMAQAVKAKADLHAERLAKGQSPDTGEEAQDITDLIADLNSQ